MDATLKSAVITAIDATVVATKWAAEGAI